MGSISVSLPNDGDTIDSSDYNTPITTIVNAINGNLDSDNLAANAVGTLEIQDRSVNNAKLSTTAGEPGGAPANGTPSATGFSSKTSDYLNYVKIGKTVFCYVYIYGTSNATTLTFTLPFAGASGYVTLNNQATNNSARVATPAKILIPYNSTTATCYINPSDGAWTDSGTKGIEGFFFYFCL